MSVRCILIAADGTRLPDHVCQTRPLAVEVPVFGDMKATLMTEDTAMPVPGSTEWLEQQRAMFGKIRRFKATGGRRGKAWVYREEAPR